jgi:rsbT co-antagonist protein RsbR
MSELASSTLRSDLMKDADLQSQASEPLRLFADAAQSSSDVQSEAFASTREFLKDVAKSRMEQGFTPAETALFVLSLKQPVFNALRGAVRNSSDLIDEIWTSGNLLDKLAMLTVTSAVGFREQTILRQQEEML